MYYIPKLGKTVLTLSEVRGELRDVSLPDFFTIATVGPLGVFEVAQVPPPAVRSNQRAEAAPPELVNGKWTQQWRVRAATAQEMAEALATLQASIVQAVEDRLNRFAQTRGYDDIKSASDYAAQSVVPRFQTEGRYALERRAATWARLYEILAEVQAGTRPAPTGYADIEPLLPTLEWPQ